MSWLQISTTLTVDYNLQSFARKAKGIIKKKAPTCKTGLHPTAKFDFQSFFFFFLKQLWNNYFLKSEDLKNNITSQVIPFIVRFDSSWKSKQRHNAVQPQQLGWKLLQIVRRSCKLEIGNEKVRNDSLKKKKKKTNYSKDHIL